MKSGVHCSLINVASMFVVNFNSFQNKRTKTVFPPFKNKEKKKLIVTTFASITAASAAHFPFSSHHESKTLEI
jgi:hypothetical protein